MPRVRVDGTHFSPDTRTFIELLSKHDVQYLIVGGEAVIFHGYARLTGDTDFFYGRHGANAQRLFTALEEFWAGEIPGIEAPAELTAAGVIFQFGVPPNRIDLINEIDGVEFDAAWPARVEAVMVTPNGESPIWYMSLDDLIKNKQLAGRPKDEDDLTYLSRARHGR
jgi:hypothetical protein